MDLTYRSMVYVEDLKPNECTIHRAITAGGTRYWLLWFYVARETDGFLEDFAVPVNPNGSYTEAVPYGKTWGLTKTTEGVWQISPSINVANMSNDAGARQMLVGQQPTGRSLWHQTPRLVGVPISQPWML